MSVALLDDLTAGYARALRIAHASPPRAKAANPADHVHTSRLADDSVPCEGLRISANPVGAEHEPGADSQTFAGVRKPRTARNCEERRRVSQLSQNSQGSDVTCTNAGGDRQANPLMTGEHADSCHAPSWTGAEIEAFMLRRDRLMRSGRTAQEAEGWAERLTLRDREGDDRRICFECGYGRSKSCPGGAPLQVLNRCPWFAEASTSAGEGQLQP